VRGDYNFTSGGQERGGVSCREGYERRVEVEWVRRGNGGREAES